MTGNVTANNIRDTSVTCHDDHHQGSVCGGEAGPDLAADDGRVPGGGPGAGLHSARLPQHRAEEGRPRHGRQPRQPRQLRHPRQPLDDDRGGQRPDGGRQGGIQQCLSYQQFK